MISVRPASNTPVDGLPDGIEVHALKGHLYVPRRPRGLIIVPSNDRTRIGVVGRAIAEAVQGAGFATCHVSLLDSAEAADPQKSHDSSLLVRRLQAVFEFVRARPRIASLPMGLLGHGLLAEVVMSAAALEAERVRAVVCVCGRQQHATSGPEGLRAATLFVAPARDAASVRASEEAFWSLECPSQLAVIRDAGRHFTESGALLACQRLITDWYLEHVADLPARPASTTISGLAN